MKILLDLKKGKSLYVQIIPCDICELNDKEKFLINLFDSTKSYNKTKGGSKVWIKPD